MKHLLTFHTKIFRILQPTAHTRTQFLLTAPSGLLIFPKICQLDSLFHVNYVNYFTSDSFRSKRSTSSGNLEGCVKRRPTHPTVVGLRDAVWIDTSRGCLLLGDCLAPDDVMASRQKLLSLNFLMYD